MESYIAATITIQGSIHSHVNDNARVAVIRRCESDELSTRDR